MNNLKPCSINDLQNGGITFILPAVLAGPEKKPSDKYIKLFTKNYQERNISEITVVTTAQIKEALEKEDLNATFVVDDNPKARFARMVNEDIKTKPFIHETVTVLDPDSVKIGKNVTIHPYVVIYGNTEIGDNTIIHANTVIGFPGFGPVWDEKASEWVMFPQIAKVIIGENTHIGACTTIQKGALEDTVIGAGSKISDHVRIGHGVNIGKNCVITCCTEISGSVKIGEKVWIGPQTSIRESLTIGDNSVIGIGSNLTKNVPENVTYVGNPACELKRT